jgi:hypothetical protein
MRCFLLPVGEESTDRNPKFKIRNPNLPRHFEFSDFVLRISDYPGSSYLESIPLKTALDLEQQLCRSWFANLLGTQKSATCVAISSYAPCENRGLLTEL